MGWNEERKLFALHNVLTDPLQEHDLATQDPQTRQAMWEALVAIRRGAAAPPPETLSWERIQELHARGATDYW